MFRNGPWSYRAGPNTLGIGVDNMALLRQGVGVDMPNYGPRYSPQKSMVPLAGAQQFPIVQSLPAIGIRANGAYVSGAMQLQALVDFNKDNKLS